MIDDVVDIVGTMLLIVAPIVLVLIVIVVVVAYPWVVLIPLGIWWVVARTKPIEPGVDGSPSQLPPES